MTVGEFCFGMNEALPLPVVRNVRDFELACEEGRADKVLRVSEILQREGIESKFKIGYIDVESGDNVYLTFPTWQEANEKVRTYQRNAIPAWHDELEEDFDE